MKLIIVLMTTCLLQVSAAGFAQKVTYARKGATLEQIFGEIRKQTGYFVVYAEGKVNKQAKLDVNFRNTDLTDVLDVISKSQDLSYSINEKNIGLKPKESSFLADVIARFQTIDVRGVVTDTTMQPLPGATVRVKNGKQAAVTNARGQFLLKNIERGSILIFSYLGYTTREIPAVDDMGDVPLSLSLSKLDEVQVQAYGKTSKRLSTGTITTINSQELGSQPVDNPLYALMGRVPNLQVTPTSGSPGSPVTLQLRGQNSLNGLRTEPLIVLDGVPTINNLELGNMNSLSLINVNDIESINVLADADATSIYGSRGASGVIIITTKSGKSGETKVSANFSSGFSQMLKRYDLMNTDQYLAMRREAFANDKITPQNHSPYEPGYAPDLFLWDQNRDFDWQEELLGGKAKTFNTGLSISGGNANLNYLLSGSLQNQGFLSPGDGKFQNGSGRIKVAGKSPNQRMQVSVTGSYTAHNAITPSIDFTRQAFQLSPNAPEPYLSSGQLNWQPDPITGIGTWVNPYAQLLIDNSSKGLDFNGSADVSYRIAGKLFFKLSGGLRKSRIENTILTPIVSQDPATWETATGRSEMRGDNVQSWTVDPQLIYTSPIGLGKLDVLLGGSYQGEQQNTLTSAGEGYTNDALLGNINAAPVVFAINASNEYKYIGSFARITYNYDDRYILNLNGRRDGSSRFGPGYQFGNFGSVGAAWIFTSEPFFEPLSKWLSFGKLRGSIGTSGNDRIANYQYLQFYQVVDGLYQNLIPLHPEGASNPDYHWENVVKEEVGIDLGFLKDKVLLGANYFRTKAGDQLASQPMPATAGPSSVTFNSTAKIQNSGWEFNVSTNNVSTKNFKWQTSGTFSLQRNKLLRLPTGYEAGSALFQYYRRHGEDPVGKTFDGYANGYQLRGVDSQTGLYIFTNSQGISAPAEEAFDLAQLTKTMPSFNGGISNTVSYRGLGLTFFVQFAKQKGPNYLINDIFVGAGKFNQNQPIGMLRRWQKAGDATDIQKFSAEDFSVHEAAVKAFRSDKNWVDATFARLKNVSISYQLSPKVLSRLPIKNLSLFVNAQNLWTLTNYEGLDPDILSGSLIPPLNTWVMGISLEL